MDSYYHLNQAFIDHGISRKSISDAFENFELQFVPLSFNMQNPRNSISLNPRNSISLDPRNSIFSFSGESNNPFAVVEKNDSQYEELKTNNSSKNSKIPDPDQNGNINAFKPRSSFSLKFNPRNSIISITSKCIKCSSNIDVIAFLCDENLCKLCVSTFACEEIISYCVRINTSVVAERKFQYHCVSCGKVISVPTRMVIYYYLMNSDKEVDEAMRNFLYDISVNHLQLFDGLQDY